MPDFDTSNLEENVIGAMLNDEANFDEVAERLKADHFYNRYYGMLYSVMSKLLMKNVKLQVDLVCQNVKEQPKGVDLKAMLMRFRVDAPSSIKDAADYIIDGYQRREAIAKLTVDAVKLINDDSKPAKEQIEASQGLLSAISETAEADTCQSFAEASMSFVESVQDAWNGSKDPGILTNFQPLDQLFNGLMAGELAFIFGYPSIGKSTLGMQAAEGVAIGTKTVRPRIVGFLSNEMSLNLITANSLSRRTGLDPKKMIRGHINQAEMESLAEAQRQRANMPLYIDATGATTIESIRIKAKKMRRQLGIEILFFDHFHNMKRQHRDSERSYSENAHGLQELAQELGIPIVVLGQLNKIYLERGNVQDFGKVPRPIANDIRGSGAPYEVADHVVFINRPAYWLSRFGPEKKSEQWQEDMDRWTGKAQLIHAKNRMGEAGRTNICGFNGQRHEFTELEYQPDFGGF